jgi:polyisoprenoid-binding protein YceI
MEHRERWLIDPERSTMLFRLRHLVVSEIGGRFRRLGGDLLLDPQEPARSTVRVWIDLASIETGSVERDDHVVSPEFLDVVKFPRAEFWSSAIEVRDPAAVTVTGKLALHGTVRPVELEVERLELEPPPAGRADAGRRSAYTARARLNRQSFGLRWNQDLDSGGVVVGDEIELTARVELVRAD